MQYTVTINCLSNDEYSFVLRYYGTEEDESLQLCSIKINNCSYEKTKVIMYLCLLRLCCNTSVYPCVVVLNVGDMLPLVLSWQ